MLHKFTLNYADIHECLPFFQMLFDENKIGVMVTDPQGELVYFNQAQERIDELKARDALGRKLYEVYNFTTESSPGMQVLRSQKPIINGCHFYRTKLGKQVNASCDIYPLHSGGGILLGAICYIQGYSALVPRLQNVKTHLAGESGSGPRGPIDDDRGNYLFSSLVGLNENILEAVELARLSAASRSPVMLIGETGVGKEIFAQSIHYEGPRKDRPYTAINCSAVPETLLEGILFGTTKGSFTGATNKAGLFEISDKGTLFLDELDSMPVSLQSKLLRALQEQKVRRVGDVREKNIDLKIISSARSDPLELIEKGILRADFYYRLGVVKIAIPPLRGRLDDLPLLADHFLAKHGAALGIPKARLDDDLTALFRAHDWPGNVRELEHVIEAMLNLSAGRETLGLMDLYRACPELVLRKNQVSGPPNHVRSPEALPAAGRGPAAGQSLSQAQQANEREAISGALKAASGNRSLAARLLGISTQSLHYKINKNKLSVADYIPAGF